MNLTYEELQSRLQGLRYERKCVEHLTRLNHEIKAKALDYYDGEICVVENKINDMRQDAQDILIEMRFEKWD